MPSATFRPETKYSTRLSRSCSASATTLYVDELPVESTGILMIDKDSEDNYEIILYGAKSGTGTTVDPYLLSSVVRGLGSSGTTVTAGTGKVHGKVEIGCADAHYFDALLKLHIDNTQLMPMVASLATLPTSSNTQYDIRFVKDQAAWYYWSISASSGVTGDWLTLVISAVANATETAQGKVELGTPADNTAASATGDSGGPLAMQPRYTSDAFLGAGEAGYAVILNASGEMDYNFLASGPEMQAAMNGASANVTAANLNTLNAGAASNADALHTHTAIGSLTFTAYEAISIRDAVALLPIEVEHFAQLTGANLALGDVTARGRYAIKIIPSATTSTLTTMQFRAAEAVNGATTLGDLTISIQLDTAGAPSGTAIANGTANVISQVTQRTWNTTQASRTATWGTPPTLTAGTTYWIVFQVASIDVTNYLNLSVNSSHNENYHTFTRLTYDAFAGTWGNSVTNATPFFWFDTQPYLLGHALAQCDANWGARTWNFIGFATAAIAAQASGTVYTSVATLTGLTPGQNYYLSATPGALVGTAPSGDQYAENTEPTIFVYKIGRALSSTQLKIEPGCKRVFMRESTVLSASTTRQYVIWFKPDTIKVIGGGVGGAGDEGGITGGYYTAGGEGAAGMAIGPTTTGSPSASATSSLYTHDAGNLFAGDASALTNAGFTYTLTETGTANVALVLEATLG